MAEGFIASVARLLSQGDGPELPSLLSRLGFLEPQRAEAYIRELIQAGLIVDLETFLQAIAASPDPDSALINLERFLTSRGRPLISSEARPLLLVLGASRFLSNLLCKSPEVLDLALHPPYFDTSKPREVMEAELKGLVAGVREFKDLMAILRRYKYRELLRIAARDLTGRADLPEVCRELTDLAGSILEVTVAFGDEMLRHQHGRPLYQDMDGTVRESAFVVLGLGKLGGEELNFSSDVDLLYLYSSDKGGTEKGVTLHEYYVKLSELVTKALSSMTEDGLLYRVDLRLRPEGARGELANSLRSAEIYYESWGASWERLALLKALPVAGDRNLGEAFIKMVEPFVYRKYLDFTAIEEIKELKWRIDRSIMRMRGGPNVKLGAGGIRELEFFVQALQVINGGKDPKVRERNTLKALSALYQQGYINEEEHLNLVESYKFLRTVEHRIQMVDERQSHDVPREERERRRLARSMGFADFNEFSRALSLHMDRVKGIYDRLFFEPERAIEQERHPEIDILFAPGMPQEEAEGRLLSLGFSDPSRALAILTLLRDGPPFAHFSARSRRALRRIAPLLFKEMASSPDPDMALANLESFVSKVGARGTFYSLLAENPKTLKLLIGLFGTSQFLSRLLISHPDLLDSLVYAKAALDMEEGDLFSQLCRLYRPLKGLEERLDALRRFRNLEVLKVGMRDIYGEMTPFSIFSRLSDLAEACVKASLEIAYEEMLKRFPPPKATLSIVGLGKLGGREMNYGSDLDLIFIYSQPEEGGQEFFSRLAQRVISVLSSPTKEGYLFKVDTRLRPSGSQGTLVTSLPAFKRYHEVSSRPWERFALTKARFIAGDPALGEEIMGVINPFIYERPFEDWMVEEMNRLRVRMERELVPPGGRKYNIKVGRGGIVDIEFVIRLIQIRNNIREGNSLKALEAIYHRGLIGKNDYETLKGSYVFLRSLENRLRIVHDLSVVELDVRPQNLERLAKGMGYRDGERLLNDYLGHTERVRGIYSRFFGRR